MHILYLFPHFIQPGGAAAVTLSTAKLLNERGIKATILAQEGKKEIFASYNNIDFEFVGGPLPKDIRYWIYYLILYFRVHSKILTIKPDIIFPQVFPSNYWGFIYKLLNPKSKCVWYCHEPSAFVHNELVIDGLPQGLRLMAHGVRPLMIRIDKFFGRRCDLIFVNSEFTAKRVKQIYGVNAKVVYPGIDLSEFPSQSLPKDDYFFYAGLLTRFKNVDLLIRAVSQLASEGQKVTLIVAGGGPEKEALASLAQELNVSDRVLFVGALSRPDLISFMARALCVLFPSVEEPLGIVPLEAQAAYTPVIAFRSGGCLETIKDGETGLLIEPLTYQRMAEAMAWATLNKDKMIEMGKNGREMIERKFLWNHTVSELIDGFESLMNRKVEG